jgi:2-methylcitrate dehydratase PrpD
MSSSAADPNAFVRELAAFVAAFDVRRAGEATLEAVRLHALDTVAATHAGSRTSEFAVTADVFRRLGATSAAAAALLCVACRSTECDDIDLASCTTPGSVVFAAALGACALGPVDPRAFAEGAIAGYEVMTALGAAADGPSIVYQAQWPTYLGGAMTAAATVGKILGLDERRMLHALAIAASMTTGTAGRIAADPTSRWLTLGCAVQSGIAAAVGAGAGLIGDEAIFATALTLPARPAPDAGNRLALERVGLKPYHSSRQALAATEAFAALVRDEQLDADAIESVDVLVPAAYRAMIDRTKLPQSKSESRGIRYQLALAAFYPDDLFDIERRTLRTSDPRVTRLIERVGVSASDDLTRRFPQAWPGAVRVKTARGTFEREVIHPRGDVENPLRWDDLERKWTAVYRSVPASIPLDRLTALVRNADAAGLWSVLLSAS